MPTDVHFLVAADEPHAVVQLQGVLDRASAEPLRGALLSLVADRTPTVIDVTGLRIADPAAMSVFGEISRETAEWPCGQPLINVPDAVAGAWSTTGVRLADGRPPAGRALLRAELEPVTGAARKARELVTEACGRWELPAVAGSACIVATELVNNVVVHARTPMTVLVGQGAGSETVRLSVRDHATAVPVFAGPVPTTAYGGRGLLIVEAVAQRWGTTLLPDGKLVWALVAD